MKTFLLAAVALTFAAPASAATYLLHYTSTSGTPMTASLQVGTADAVNAVGGYDIVSIGGRVGSDVITGLVGNPNHSQPVNSADGFFTYDNVLFPNAPVLSNPGVLFNSADGFEYNLFSRNLSQYDLYQARPGVGYTQNSVGILSLDTVPANAVPEPAHWAMMLVGFGMMGSMLRRRRAATRTVFA